MKLNITVLLIFISTLSFSQSELTSQINLLMNQIRTGSAGNSEKAKILSNPNFKEISQSLSKFFTDSSTSVRYEALNMNSQIALKSNDKLLIKNSIQNIVRNCVMNGSINNQIASLLKKFSRSDFNSEELLLINNTLQAQQSNLGILTKIYAFAGQAAVSNDITLLLSKQNLTKSDKKDVKLALVRCGDERLTNKMYETLKQQVINDDLIYSALPDVIYTKNKLLYGHLLNGILSDDKKCSSANNDDSSPIICAYRLIEQIAPHVTNFPVTINTKGEINTKDFGKTLTDVREWISKNKDNLEIDFSHY